MALCLCVFTACEKDEPIIPDEPTVPPTEQPEQPEEPETPVEPDEPDTPAEPEEPQEPISTDGIINWNNEFIIVGDNNMATVGNGTWYSVCYGDGKYVAVGFSSSYGNNVAYSTDGVNWGTTKVENIIWNDVIYDGVKFVVVGAQGSIASSTDGVNWVYTQLPSTSNLQGICPVQ